MIAAYVRLGRLVRFVASTLAGEGASANEANLAERLRAAWGHFDQTLSAGCIFEAMHPEDPRPFEGLTDAEKEPFFRAARALRGETEP